MTVNLRQCSTVEFIMGTVHLFWKILHLYSVGVSCHQENLFCVLFKQSCSDKYHCSFLVKHIRVQSNRKVWQTSEQYVALGLKRGRWWSSGEWVTRGAGQRLNTALDSQCSYSLPQQPPPWLVLPGRVPSTPKTDQVVPVCSSKVFHCA